MKILAFVDLHADSNALSKLKTKAKKADIVICAGDFTVFERNIKKIMCDISKLHKKVFLVHGNHEEESIVQILSKNYKSLEFIHKKIVVYEDYVIIGYGGGGFTERYRLFEDFIKENKKKLIQYKKDGKKIILVTHAPFYNTSLDLITENHNGSKSFSNFIKDIKPEIAICGHFHENSGKSDMIKKTKVYNPGANGMIIEV